MSNYTNENLIIATAKTGERAIKIGDKIFVGLDSGGGGSVDYYKCATVQVPSEVTYYIVSGAGTSDCNGRYDPTGITKNGYPVYARTGMSGEWYLFYFSTGQWVISMDTLDISSYYDAAYAGLDYLPGSWEAVMSDEPAPTLTQSSESIGSKTWAGYKAVKDPITEIYSFEQTATSGLTYNLIQPQVEKIYTDDAMIKVELYTGIPLSGLDFYLPLQSHMNDIVHNYVVNNSQDYNNEFTISSDQTGSFLHCTKSDGYSNSNISWPATASEYKYGTSDFSISFWLRAPNWSTNNDGSQVLLSKKYNDSDTGIAIQRGYQADVLNCRVAYENNFQTTAVVTSSDWVHWCVVRRNGAGYWYRNGVQNSTGTMNGSFSSDAAFTIGYHGQAGWLCNAEFDLKELKIYNRALSQAEVVALFNEF